MRLLTRADLDGLTCGVLLSVVEPIDEVVFVEPHRMQRGEVEVRPDDIIANLPYHPGCGMWFDHHISNKPPEGTRFKGAFHIDPSAARTIYDYYKDPRLDRYRELLDATDRVDAAYLTLDEIRNPTGYVLLSLTLDPRTHLEPSDSYCHDLLEWLKSEPVEAILAKPEVARRCRRILDDQKRFEQLLLERSRRVGQVVITDLRGIAKPPAGSRFLVYALFPECNASIKIYPARDDPDAVGISLGHSIINRTQHVNVGRICARYGGGGHRGAGSFVISPDRVDEVVQEVLAILQRNEPGDTL